MDLELRGKKALVLAASKGIGKGAAMALAREGCTVIIASSDFEHLARAKSDIEHETRNPVMTYRIDLKSLKSVNSVCSRILKRHRGIDILITNSPGPKPMEAVTVTEQALAEAIHTNLLSVILLCKKFLPRMIKNRFGRIINLASTTALEPDMGMVLSNVARAGTVAYCKTLSREVAKFGITVNSILTGGVMTDRTISLLKLSAKKLKIPYKKLLAQATENFPVGYIATPEQFSHTIVFLASPLSMFVNGVSLPVDGGLMRSL